MFGAVDSARSTVEAMVEPHPVNAVQAAVAGGAHVAFLAAEGGFAAFQANCPSCVQAAGSDALRDAPLLVLAALIDGGGMALHGGWRGLDWGRLGKADGRSKCEKSDAY